MSGKSINKVFKATVVIASWCLLIASLNHVINFKQQVPEVQFAFLFLFTFISFLIGGSLYNILNQK